MPLPITFANQTAPALPDLDTNFAALGALTAIPCAVAGTNTLLLTPAADTPTIGAYVDYQPFCGIAAGTNTGAVTAQIGSGLAALPVYLDTPSGTLALAGGEIIAGCAVAFIHDSALNSGAGGFHLFSAGAFLPASGSGIPGPFTIGGALGVATSITAGGTVTGASVHAAGALTAGTSVTAVGALAGAAVSASGAVAAGTSVTAAGAVSGASITASGALSGLALTVGAGTALTRLLSAAATVGFSVVAAGASQDQTVAALGAAVLDTVLIGQPSVVPAGLLFSGYVSAAGVITLRAANITGTSINPGSPTVRLTVLGFT